MTSLCSCDWVMYFVEVMYAGSCNFFGNIYNVICNFSTINIFIHSYMHSYMCVCITDKSQTNGIIYDGNNICYFLVVGCDSIRVGG